MVKAPKTEETSPDLFSSVPKPASGGFSTQPSPNISPEPRFILPADISEALKRLQDIELQRLAEAVQGELSRRHVTVPNIPIVTHPVKTSASSPASAKSRNPKRATIPSGGAPLPLNQSRINAIRAAFRAGVKPSIIARQFGVSLSAIQRALKRDEQ